MHTIEPLERRRLLAVLLPGFVETPVTGNIARGTTLEIAPDGKLYVVEQGGTIQVYSSYKSPNAQLQPNFFRDAPLTIPWEVLLNEGGLIGLAFDPDYENNRFVYVHYTRRFSSSHYQNRISRFTANEAGDLALPGSEQVLLDIEPTQFAGHFGGALHFGPDGKLYIAVGDHGEGTSQFITTLKGKILRINPTPGNVIPDDNPSSIAGIAGTTNGIHRAIWAAGLRNPYTFAFQSSTGRMFINDVGALSWEEINEGGAGRNFGWPLTEGDFDPVQFPHFTRPLLAYPNPTIGHGVIGAAFYEPTTTMFPPHFAGDYFFGDLSRWVAWLDLPTSQMHSFASDTGFSTDLRIAPDGSLLYLQYAGRVLRVTYDDVAPSVTTSAFDFDGVTLPDRPHRLRFTFSEDVYSSLSPSDLTLVNLTTGKTIDVADIALSYDATTTTATFTFPGFPDAIMPDGRYRATLEANGVTDPAGNALAADVVLDYFVLSADANHDGRVNLIDFNRLAINFGQSGRAFSQGDFNYDGRVDPSDFNLLAQRFGMSVEREEEVV